MDLYLGVFNLIFVQFKFINKSSDVISGKKMGIFSVYEYLWETYFKYGVTYFKHMNSSTVSIFGMYPFHQQKEIETKMLSQYHGGSALRSMETTHQSIVVLRCKVVIVGNDFFYLFLFDFLTNFFFRGGMCWKNCYDSSTPIWRINIS
jgi:hypothetical protein